MPIKALHIRTKKQTPKNIKKPKKKTIITINQSIKINNFKITE